MRRHGAITDASRLLWGAVRTSSVSGLGVSSTEGRDLLALVWTLTPHPTRIPAAASLDNTRPGHSSLALPSSDQLEPSTQSHGQHVVPFSTLLGLPPVAGRDLLSLGDSWNA